MKLLGVWWDTERDKFQFDFKEVTTFVKSLPPTKRSILRISAKAFDPLGLLSPFTIGAKMLFQVLCKSKRDWDLILNDDHIICCRGRLNQADLPSSMKNPVLLPTKHQFTELLVMERHHAVHHNGSPETLAAVREKYWIVKGRVVVKKVIRRCFICR